MAGRSGRAEPPGSPRRPGAAAGSGARPARVEHDFLGDVAVPEGVRWGPQTQRALGISDVSGERFGRSVIAALGMLKAEAARVNASLRSVPAVTRAIGAAVAAAAEEVAAGRFDDQFPLDVFQTGSGTATNMNANEVIAALAGERLGAPVHPNDHVNASQSSNDVFPSVVHLAVMAELTGDLLPALAHLARSLRRARRRFRGVPKAGRTHLMDAVPVTLGQEFGGYATQVEDAGARLEDQCGRLGALALGGTATGTGLNAPPSFAPRVIAALAERTGLPLREAPDHFAAQGARDELVACSGDLRATAIALVKIANDLRWMASGPTAGLGELRLPALAPGSSIMPGKVNPVASEIAVQVAAQVVGNDAAVAFAGAQGAFELNANVPVIARNVLVSIRLLGGAARLLADRAVDGAEADAERCARGARSSPALATVLAPIVGYAAAADIVRASLEQGRSIRDVVVARGLLSPADADRLLDVEAMTRGGVVGTERSGDRDG